ncbi:MAG: 2,3-bisphosphoglycerate-independent phosphoglycerate mutase [Dehalococcoidia bacterium]|nr:2,3-bisphosphoglycerate-independent phosphoglycerate mutase [Dehalococcoidia bacterium]
MANLELMRELSVETPSKIVMLVADGLGGLPGPDGLSELETAHLPNLHQLAAESITGLIQHVPAGLTPGSGPGHLALFGYDPLVFDIGRGVLEALGIDFDLQPGDLAARGNFCTVDEAGRITDRRAGRIPTALNVELCAELRAKVRLDGVETFIEPVEGYRFALVLRGPGLAEGLTETDPQREGVVPFEVAARRPEAQQAARLANHFIAQARAVLKDKRPANMVMLRGFANKPPIPPMHEVYRLRTAAVAVYPMYRGLAKLAGMDVFEGGKTFSDELEVTRKIWQDYDFIYLHYKWADSAGEDGDFAGKVVRLEELDAAIPAVRAMKPDVLMVTGDHATPAVLKAHSWHPVPFLLNAPWRYPDDVRAFTERDCRNGELGRFPATDVMPLAMAHAMKLTKFGA